MHICICLFTYIYVCIIHHASFFPHIFVWGSRFWFCAPVRVRPASSSRPVHPHTLTHTSLTHTSLTHNSLTHNSLTHNSLTHNLLTHNLFTHNVLTHLLRTVIANFVVECILRAKTLPLYLTGVGQ